MLLYTFISHSSKVLEKAASIQKDMKKIDYDHYKIFYCGENKNIDDKKIIHLECDDNYEGLPNKIHHIAKYILSSDLCNYYSHIYKIDATNKPKKIIELLSEQNYYGYLLSRTDLPEYRRTYHFNRCSEESGWNQKRYDGEFVPYCAGGYGYVLSLLALKCISENPNDPDKDIYEDLYVAQALLKCGIKPYHIDSRKYISNL